MFLKYPFINMGTNEENIIENLVCFIYGGAGPLNRLRLRLRPKSTGSATLAADYPNIFLLQCQEGSEPGLSGTLAC